MFIKIYLFFILIPTSLLVNIMPGAIISQDVTTKGDITFSSGCIVQSKATIIAESGPIIFGKNCIIEEGSTIIFSLPEHLRESNKPLVLNIGTNNIFGNGCTVKASKIGNNNVFERQSNVPESVQISNRCVIGGNVTAKGDINFSEGSVVQSGAKIIADSGPITFGENCVIEKDSTIEFKVPEHLKYKHENPYLNIGSNNVFGNGCVVKALKIGSRNVFERGSYVSENVEISNGCVIGAGVRLDIPKMFFHLGENSVIYKQN